MDSRGDRVTLRTWMLLYAVRCVLTRECASGYYYDNIIVIVVAVFLLSPLDLRPKTDVSRALEKFAFFFEKKRFTRVRGLSWLTGGGGRCLCGATSLFVRENGMIINRDGPRRMRDESNTKRCTNKRCRFKINRKNELCRRFEQSTKIPKLRDRGKKIGSGSYIYV